MGLYCFYNNKRGLFGKYYIFEMLVDNRWIKTIVIVGEDFKNLNVKLSNWDEVWGRCINDIKKQINSLTVDKEPVIVIFRILNSDVNIRDMPKKLLSKNSLINGGGVDFQYPPGSNPLSIALADRWEIDDQEKEKQLTEVFYLKKGRRMVKIESNMTFLDLRSNVTIGETGTIFSSVYAIYNYFLSYISSYSTIYTNHFSPFKPLRATIVLDAEFIPVKIDESTEPQQFPESFIPRL